MLEGGNGDALKCDGNGTTELRISTVSRLKF